MIEGRASLFTPMKRGAFFDLQGEFGQNML